MSVYDVRLPNYPNDELFVIYHRQHTNLFKQYKKARLENPMFSEDSNFKLESCWQIPTFFLFFYWIPAGVPGVS